MTELALEQTPDFGDYLAAFRRRLGLIVLVTGLIFLLGLITAFSWPPTYQASATILIEESRPQISTAEELLGYWSGYNYNFLPTQYEILKSRDLAEKVGAKLRRSDYPLLDPARQDRLSFSLANLIPDAWRGEQGSEQTGDDEASLSIVELGT